MKGKTLLQVTKTLSIICPKFHQRGRQTSLDASEDLWEKYAVKKKNFSINKQYTENISSRIRISDLEETTQMCTVLGRNTEFTQFFRCFR